MSSLKLDVAKLTADPDPEGWVQVYDFKDENVDESDEIHLIVAKKGGEGGVEGLDAGRTLASQIQDAYFSGYDQSHRLACLKNAVEFATKYKPSEFQLVAVVYSEGCVFCAAYGGGQLAIFRNSLLGRLIISSTGNLVTGSGMVNANDILIAATSSFFEKFPDGVIKASLQNGDVKSYVEYLAPKIHLISQKGTLAVVFLGFSMVPELSPQTVSNETVQAKIRGTFKVGDYSTKILPDGFRRFYEKVARSLGRLYALIDKKLPQRSVVVNIDPAEYGTPFYRKRRLSLTVGLALTAILVMSTFFGLKRNGDRKSQNELGGRISEAQHLVDEATSLFSLNPDRARQLFSQGKSRYEDTKKLGHKSEKLDELGNLISSKEGQILGKYTTTAGLFLDLSLVTNDFTGDEITLSDSNIYILDKLHRKIIEVGLDNKKTKVVAGPNQTKEVLGASYYFGNVYILSSDGVYKLGGEKPLIDKYWQDTPIIKIYSGNLYVIDRNAAMIWRHSSNANSFSGPSKWLADGVVADFSQAKSVNIDGSIWILTGNKIEVYSLGVKRMFNLSEVVPVLSDIEWFYKDETTSSIYILDKKEKRITVFSVDGAFVAQYFSDELGNANGLVVSEKLKKIVFLAKDKLFELELKHL